MSASVFILLNRWFWIAARVGQDSSGVFLGGGFLASQTHLGIKARHYKRSSQTDFSLELSLLLMKAHRFSIK